MISIFFFEVTLMQEAGGALWTPIHAYAVCYQSWK